MLNLVLSARGALYIDVTDIIYMHAYKFNLLYNSYTKQRRYSYLLILCGFAILYLETQHIQVGSTSSSN